MVAIFIVLKRNTVKNRGSPRYCKADEPFIVSLGFPEKTEGEDEVKPGDVP